LRPVKNIFRSEDYPNLLVGLNEPDDAAVWKLDDDRALVVTTDFFTPIVDNAYDFGQIAAANALSDIYAMGGQPFLALNIAAFPENLPFEILGEIMKGGAEKAREAGVVIAGGHSIKDQEPKYGLVVLGFVDPLKKLTKSGVKPGDSILLTKPLGMGVTTTALKQEKADDNDLAEAVLWMKQLNKKASELAVEFNLAGATDVTGFSMLGHALEMADSSGVKIQFQHEAIPFLSCARKYARMGTIPGGARENQNFFGPRVFFQKNIPGDVRLLLFDPQTNGGLLLAVPPGQLSTFLKHASQAKQPAWVVGKAIEGEGIEVI